MSMRNKKQKFSGVGGQAVLEGVMMKAQDRYAVAVRKESGEIVSKVEEYKGIFGDSFVKKTPFLRGVFQFVDSILLGMKALTYSTDMYEEEIPKKEIPKKESPLRKALGEKLDTIVTGITMVLSFGLAIGLFMILPYFISGLFQQYLQSTALQGVVEGMIRISIFVGYVSIISFMKDIHRLYQYHGAEHKCINCIENGNALTVENVMKSSKEHKRCGTSFMLIVMVTSIFVFFFITVESPVYRVALRIALLPVIAGISYEFIRLAGRYENLFVRIISRPGMWLQRLTTKEPDESMVKVAIASVEAVFDWKAYLQEEFGEDSAK